MFHTLTNYLEHDMLSMVIQLTEVELPHGV